MILHPSDIDRGIFGFTKLLGMEELPGKSKIWIIFSLFAPLLFLFGSLSLISLKVNLGLGLISLSLVLFLGEQKVFGICREYLRERHFNIENVKPITFRCMFPVLIIYLFPILPLMGILEIPLELGILFFVGFVFSKGLGIEHYVNPMLFFLGYRFYLITLKEQGRFLLITKKRPEKLRWSSEHWGQKITNRTLIIG